VNNNLLVNLSKFQSSFNLIEKVADALRSCSTDKGKINRYEVYVDDYDLLEELCSIQHIGRYYWSSRDNTFEMAGWGEADVVVSKEETYSFSYNEVFSKLQEKISLKSPTLRYYGGSKFQPLDSRGKRWKVFRAYRFVVPRVELFRDNSGTRLVANIVGGDASFELEQFLDMLKCLKVWLLNESLCEESEPYIFFNRIDCPSKHEWTELVNRALIAIDRGSFEKVVLARESTFESNRYLDPVSILRKVSKDAFRCYHFCFNPSPDRGFIGVSPERLYYRVSTYMETEALAGTIPRGKNEDEDLQLKSVLLTNKKERMEHEIVVNMLKNNMEQLCCNYEYDVKPQVITLSTVHHLYTYFRGILRASVTDSDILELLHPTPAIGGYPKSSALEWIKREEPIDRGIYTGPVGWISYDSAEFCVGIRSALVQGNHISLYSGAGIVIGSQPESEWYELESKIKGYINVLVCENSQVQK